MGVSERTGKSIKSTKNFAVRDHVLVCNNVVWLMGPMALE